MSVHPSPEQRVRDRFLHGGPDDPDSADSADPHRRLAALVRDELPLLAADEVERRARDLAAELVGLGAVQGLLDDPDVTDVLVNGPGHVWVERRGRLERTDVVLDRDDIERDIERLVAPLGLRADRSNPVVDARLADGTRVAVVLEPLAVDGPVLAIRRHVSDAVPLDAFGPPATVGLLRALVAARANIGIYGATGAGKTTLVNALLREVPAGERIVTIEDVAELRPGGGHVVRLEARPGTADGIGRAGIRDLVRAALRLRPDRIVLGEARGAESLDVVWALSTGHDGSIATWHASGPVDALERIATLCAFATDSVPHGAIRSQVHAAFDVLVGVERRPGGTRRVRAVHGVARDGSLRDLSRLEGVSLPGRSPAR